MFFKTIIAECKKELATCMAIATRNQTVRLQPEREMFTTAECLQLMDSMHIVTAKMMSL